MSGFPADHEVLITLDFKSTPSGGNAEVEALLRWSSGTNTTGYECNLQHAGAYMQIVTWQGGLGSYAELAHAQSPPTPVAGDILRARINGQRIRVSLIHSGVETQYIDYTDSDNLHLSGQPGMGFYRDFGVSNAAYGAKSFTANSL